LFIAEFIPSFAVAPLRPHIFMPFGGDFVKEERRVSPVQPAVVSAGQFTSHRKKTWSPHPSFQPVVYPSIGALLGFGRVGVTLLVVEEGDGAARTEEVIDRLDVENVRPALVAVGRISTE